MIDCSNIRKGDANIKRDIRNKITSGTILRFIKFNNFGTRCLNWPRNLFLSFFCTTQRIFEPLRVFEPGFNMDKYGTYIACTHICEPATHLQLYTCVRTHVRVHVHIHTYTCSPRTHGHMHARKHVHTQHAHTHTQNTQK